MGLEKPDHLIINSPYTEPEHHWYYEPSQKSFEKRPGRRSAGYMKATPGAAEHNDPGVFIELPLVNKIRPRVAQWKTSGYPGVTGITKRLLEHWNDREQREFPLFFCQLEAIETLIWLIESPDSEKVGIDIPSDGGDFRRICSKMATGSGKTIVMAMLIAWQVLNKVTYSQDKRFSKNVLMIAPGLTVKNRLAVLIPSGKGNYYDEFNIVPGGLREKLRLGKVMIHNWHKLGWESEQRLAKKKSVDKRGAKSDEAYIRDVLGDMAKASNLLVINDEAHHAWRANPEAVGKYLRQRDMKDSAAEATIWIGGLDRIHKTRGILNCFDFSATPFAPSGNKSSEEALFGWIVSDFGLNDSIESGLVKTPRVVVRDDALPNVETYKSKLYHIYKEPEVKDDINRKAEPSEQLPSLIINGYFLLGSDWLKTAEAWSNQPTPPVMITVANTTHTAARIKYSFDHERIKIKELCDPDKTLHIDSKVLQEAETQDEPISIDTAGGDKDKTPRKLSKKQQAELLREAVDTIGKAGRPGEQIQNVISVGMLSEGWDTRTVTHIMGLRAFTSQLLCEQVVGRGLRRASYELNKETGLMDAEYVNIFGVPFTFLPHEAQEGEPKPPQPKTTIEPIEKNKGFEIQWPNVLRIETVLQPKLKLDLSKVSVLELNAAETPTVADLAATIDGKTDFTKITEINLERLAREQRMQKIIFEVARDNYDQMSKKWEGNKEYLFVQLIKIIEQFLDSEKIQITPGLFNQDELRRRIMLTMNMPTIVQHISDAVRQENIERLEPVFDADNPIRSTGDMRAWRTGKPCEYTKKSHINFCVFDSTWEAAEAFELDRNSNVRAWVKNDHLNFEIFYTYQGAVKKYRPDFIIQLTNGKFLILETKGQETQKDKTKRKYLGEWVKAVNQQGGFGQWSCAVSYNPSDVADILAGLM